MKLDLEDHLFLQHQKLLYKDQALINKNETSFGEARIGTSLMLARRTLPRGSWRTRGDRLLHGCEVEEKERNRWITHLVNLLEQAQLIEEGKRGPDGLNEVLCQPLRHGKACIHDATTCASRTASAGVHAEHLLCSLAAS